MRVSTPKILFITLISAGMAILLINKSANKDGEVAPPIREVTSSETMPLTEYGSASELPARKDDDQIKVSAAGAYLNLASVFPHRYLACGTVLG